MGEIRGIVPLILIGQEEEEIFLLDRSAYGASRINTLIESLGETLKPIEEICRLSILVTKITVRVSMILAAAAFGDDVNGAAVSEPQFRVEGIPVDLKLLDCI